MGRVKRYKKIKACDPFAPKRADPDAGGGKRKSIEYDMPPEDSDSEAQSKKRRKKEKLWERDALRDDEYMQMLETNAKQRKEKKVRHPHGIGCSKAWIDYLILFIHMYSLKSSLGRPMRA